MMSFKLRRHGPFPGEHQFLKFVIGTAFLTMANIPGRKGMLMSISGKQKNPRSDFMKRKSQAQAKMVPPPKAWPLMAAITGIG